MAIENKYLIKGSLIALGVVVIAFIVSTFIASLIEEDVEKRYTQTEYVRVCEKVDYKCTWRGIEVDSKYCLEGKIISEWNTTGKWCFEWHLDEETKNEYRCWPIFEDPE